MKNNSGSPFLTFFSPLDLATILYVLISAGYICFSNAAFMAMLPHFAIRVIILVFIICLALLNRKFSNNKPVLLIKNLYPLLFLGFFYTETSCMKNIIFNDNLDRYFFNAEQILWNCQPSLQFSNFINSGWFNELMNICYFSYYALIGSVCVILYLKGIQHAQRGIFIIIFSFYLYYIIFAVLPVVGPQYYIVSSQPDVTPLYFFGKLMRTIITDFEQPTGAFPSSHVGIAIIISYISYTNLKKLFYITLPFVIGICFATVYIKAHYLVDVIAGIISAPVFIIFSGKIYDKFLTLTLFKNKQKLTPNNY